MLQMHLRVAVKFADVTMCPECGGKTEVKDSRPAEQGLIRRRRCVVNKNHRFSTREIVENELAKLEADSVLINTLAARLHI